MIDNTGTLNTQYTIIIGAEGELGRAMAREIARKGCNLILVSTTSIDLQRFAIGLQLQHELQVNAVKLDLSNQEEIQSFSKEIQDQYEVRALINNVTCDWSISENRCISELAKDDFQTRFRGTVYLIRSLLPMVCQHPIFSILFLSRSGRSNSVPNCSNRWPICMPSPKSLKRS